MTHQLLIILAALLFAFACDSPAPAPTPDEPPEWVKEAQERSQRAEEPAEPEEPEVDLVVEKPIMWSVTAPSGAKSTLIGTFHVGTDFHGLAGLPPTAREAFEASEVVVLEADIGSPDMEKLAKYLVLPPGKSLKKMLGDERWELLDAELGSPPNLDRMQPHMVAGMLAQKWIPNAGVRGMDGRFIILARAYDKRRAYLETPEEQLQILSSVMPARYVAEMLDELDTGKKQMLDLLAAFRAGDAEKVESLTFEPEALKKEPGFYEAVFWKRNKTWTERLPPFLDKGDAFIAVGVGHLLGGELSLPTLLAAQGYEVARVP